MPSDVGTCEDCRSGLYDPRQPALWLPIHKLHQLRSSILCIIRDVPYDRSKTTMDEFRCVRRVRPNTTNPSDRRFHAEPNACRGLRASGLAFDGRPANEVRRGGPVVFARRSSLARMDFLNTRENCWSKARSLRLRAWAVFICLAMPRTIAAVGLLRERKRRSGKAFAIMTRDLETAERLCVVTAGGSRFTDERAAAYRTTLAAAKRDPEILLSDVVPGQHAPGSDAALYSAPPFAI